MSNIPGQMLQKLPPDNKWKLAFPIPASASVPLLAAGEYCCYPTLLELLTNMLQLRTLVNSSKVSFSIERRFSESVFTVPPSTTPWPRFWRNSRNNILLLAKEPTMLNFPMKSTRISSRVLVWVTMLKRNCCRTWDCWASLDIMEVILWMKAIL